MGQYLNYPIRDYYGPVFIKFGVRIHQSIIKINYYDNDPNPNMGIWIYAIAIL